MGPSARKTPPLVRVFGSSFGMRRWVQSTDCASFPRCRCDWRRARSSPRVSPRTGRRRHAPGAAGPCWTHAIALPCEHMTADCVCMRRWLRDCRTRSATAGPPFVASLTAFPASAGCRIRIPRAAAPAYPSGAWGRADRRSVSDIHRHSGDSADDLLMRMHGAPMVMVMNPPLPILPLCAAARFLGGLILALLQRRIRIVAALVRVQCSISRSVMFPSISVRRPPLWRLLGPALSLDLLRGCCFPRRHSSGNLPQRSMSRRTPSWPRATEAIASLRCKLSRSFSVG